MDIQQDQPIIARHIESKPGVCGGKPCIAGTRIRVWDIHVWHSLQGRTPEEIVADLPQITIGDVFAALAYYFDNREQIDRQMKEAEDFVAQLEAQQVPTRYTQLRDAIQKNKDGDGNPVSS